MTHPLEQHPMGDRLVTTADLDLQGIWFVEALDSLKE
jgi:hypothetical protein